MLYITTAYVEYQLAREGEEKNRAFYNKKQVNMTIPRHKQSILHPNIYYNKIYDNHYRYISFPY